MVYKGEPTKRKQCKDCLGEYREEETRYLLAPDLLVRPKLPKRDAIHPGPRCVTHHRAWVKGARARAHDKWVCKEYGLSPGDYQRLYEFQGGKCYLCQRASGKARRLAVDHDHKTGLVRGLLCKPCNKVMGHFRDNPDMFERGAHYIRRPPAQALGIMAIHRERRGNGQTGTDSDLPT